MLKLYYTGPRTYLGSQNKKELSLGGSPSSTPVPNGQEGSLFSAISSYTKQNEINEVIALILKNEGEETEDIQFYFQLPENPVASYQIAAVALNQNSKSEKYMEEIQNNQSLPYYATFYDATSENPVNLGPLESNGMIGLWIKRSVLFEIVDDEDLWNEYKDAIVDNGNIWENYKAGIERVNKEIVNLVFEEVEESSSIL